MVILFFILLNTSQIIFDGLKCKFSFNKGLRRFADEQVRTFDGQYMNRCTYNDVDICIFPIF